MELSFNWIWVFVYTSNILYYVNNFLGSLKTKLAYYSDELANILVEYHLAYLDDTEDFECAIGRKDVLFYHFAMDIALDHFLQTLFAMNRTYFPSRKRTLQYIRGFELSPESCDERLVEIIKLGSSTDTLDKSYKLWNDLIDDLKRLMKLNS